jgi:predicted dehydrogenase
MIVSAPRAYRAAAIGITGGGNYGHRLHLAFADLPNVELVAIADPDDAGRQKAAVEVGAPRTYASYHEMLEKERPDIVSVCPRWADRREEMIEACAEEGSHVYCEKPMARSLDEADRMLTAAERAGIKIAVAHQAVYLPQIQKLTQLLQEGIIGEIKTIHAYGKQDGRGGGEDTLVLGTHLFNLMRTFVGDPAWVSAHVTSSGADLTPEHVHQATEPVGLVAGDRIHSYYAFQSGASAFFQSVRYLAGKGRPSAYGMVLVGTEGRIAFGGDTQQFSIYPHRVWAPWDTTRTWQKLELETLPLLDGNRRAIVDLIDAIENDRPPISSGNDARAALEMIVGVYEAQLTGNRIAFPLQDRAHPLQRLLEDQEG